MKEIIKKLKTALQDGDTAKELEKFGIKADQIEGLEDLKVPATLDEALANKEIQSEFDRRLAKAVTTREENLKEKFDFKEKEQPADPTPETTDPALKAILAEMKSLKERLETQEKEKQQMTAAQRREKAESMLKEKGIPAIYVHELDLEKDVDEQLDNVSKKFEEQFGPLKSKSTGSKIPFPQRGEDKPSKEEIAAIVG